MGLRFRKSIKVGKHARINLSKSGVGYSVGAGGVRMTHSPKRSKKSSGSGCGSGCLGSMFKLIYLCCKWMFIIALFPITIPIIILRNKKKKEREQSGGGE